MSDKRFLVISYDHDEQQPFYDWIIAPDEETAKARICALRPYVLAAVGGISVDELRAMADSLEAASEEFINQSLVEIGQDCGSIEEDDSIAEWLDIPKGAINESEQI